MIGYQLCLYKAVLIAILMACGPWCWGSNQAKDKPTLYLPDNPQIQYSGRVDFANKTRPVFSAPGVRIMIVFYGTSCAVMLEDEFANHGRNYYDAVIDDTVVVKVRPEKNITTYTITEHLTLGNHTLIFTKRTEASIGKCTFLGFLIKGKLLSPNPLPIRKIEFIGNSITCGFGSEVSLGDTACSEDGWGQPYHNSYLSFASLLGRELKSDFHLTSVSGIGIVRNYSNKYDKRTMPEVYEKLYLENPSSSAWNTHTFIPDLIVIELGTNDFSLGDEPRPKMDSITFVKPYIAFISKLKMLYPAVNIVCLSSPMLQNGYPSIQDHFSTDLQNYLTGIVGHFNKQSNGRVHSINLKDMKGHGCSTHPDVAQHKILADELLPQLTKIMRW